MRQPGESLRRWRSRQSSASGPLGSTPRQSATKSRRQDNTSAWRGCRGGMSSMSSCHGGRPGRTAVHRAARRAIKSRLTAAQRDQRISTVRRDLHGTLLQAPEGLRRVARHAGTDRDEIPATGLDQCGMLRRMQSGAAEASRDAGTDLRRWCGRRPRARRDHGVSTHRRQPRHIALQARQGLRAIGRDPSAQRHKIPGAGLDQPLGECGTHRHCEAKPAQHQPQA